MIAYNSNHTFNQAVILIFTDNKIYSFRFYNKNKISQSILNLRVIAPDRTVWDASVEEIILPSSTGQLGILTNHAPLLTALDVGVMRSAIRSQVK